MMGADVAARGLDGVELDARHAEGGPLVLFGGDASDAPAGDLLRRSARLAILDGHAAFDLGYDDDPR